MGLKMVEKTQKVWSGCFAVKIGGTCTCMLRIVENRTVNLLTLRDSQPKRLSCQKSIGSSRSQIAGRPGA